MARIIVGFMIGIALGWHRAMSEIATLQAKIEELKQSAESEFQRAEGKEEMKRWFQDDRVRLQDQLSQATKLIERLVKFLRLATTFEQTPTWFKGTVAIVEEALAFLSPSPKLKEGEKKT